LVVVVVVFVVG